jgi:hypothetical protein
MTMKTVVRSLGDLRDATGARQLKGRIRMSGHRGMGEASSDLFGMREPGREHEAAGVAAVGWIDLAERTNLCGGDGAQRNLVACVPVVGIGHRRCRCAMLGPTDAQDARSKSRHCRPQSTSVASGPTNCPNEFRESSRGSAAAEAVKQTADRRGHPLAQRAAGPGL